MPSSITGIPQALTPGIRIRFDNSLAFNGSSAVPKVLLALGPLLTGGTATAGVPVRVSSAADAHVKFGAGSSTAIMLDKAFEASENVEMWGLGIAETGTFATGTLVLSGTAGAGDTVSIEVGGERVAIPLPVGDVNLGAATQNSPHVTTFAGGYMPRSPGFVLAAIAAAIDTDLDDGFAPRSGLPLMGWPPRILTRSSAPSARRQQRAKLMLKTWQPLPMY
ncbi:MAG: hypothetical protein ORO03_00610 [Alphaproteobacteria bacterium]|nr:hypothetical protein [Alphaproteobacteria bacterium]